MLYVVVLFDMHTLYRGVYTEGSSRSAKRNQSTKDGTKVVDRQETTLPKASPASTVATAQGSASMNQRNGHNPHQAPFPATKRVEIPYILELIRDFFQLRSPML